MAIDHERFRNIAAGAQSIVIVVAVIVGGFWSAFVLNDVAKSKNELEKLRRDIAGSIALEIGISVQQLNQEESGPIPLIVSVNVDNPGTRHVYFNFMAPSLKIRKVIYSENKGLLPDGDPIVSHYFGSEIKWHKGYNVLAGSKRTFDYYLEVPMPGIYQITFNAPIEKDLLQALTKDLKGKPAEHEHEDERPSSWASQTFVQIL